MADGTEFVIDVAVPSSSVSSVEAAADAVTKLAEQLTVSGAASAAAAEAVRAGEAAYRQAEAGADRAAKAVEKLGIRADEQRAKLEKLAETKGVDSDQYRRAQAVLDQLSQRQTEAAAKAEATKAALSTEGATLDSLRATADQAAAAHAELNSKINETKQRAEEAAAAITKADAEILASTTNRVRVMMNAFNQEALAQQKEDAEIAAATANRIAVLANAVNEEARLHAKAADEAAKSGQKMADSNKIATEGTGKVNEMAEAFGKLGGPVGLIGSKVLGAAEGFKKLRGSMGSAGLYAGAAIGITAVVAAVIALSAATASAVFSVLKWSITLSDKNKDIEKQTTRLRANVDKIFSGLKIGGIIDGLSKVSDLFEENSASAKAIKVVFESLFQPLVDGIAALIPQLVAGFIQFEILVLKALIAIKPFGSWIVKLAEVVAISFGVIAAVAGLALAAVAGMFLLLFVAPIMLAVAVVWLLVEAVKIAANWISNLGTSISNGASSAFDSLKLAVQGALEWLSNLSLADIGTMLVQGLIMGITGAGPGVVTAITKLAGSAIDAAKSALGIASPSKVFAEIGGYTAEGMAGGVDSGAPEVQSSMESMVAPPAPAAAAPAPASSSGGGAAINIENLIIQSKTDDPQGFADQFRAFIADLRAQSGRAVPA